MTSDCSESVSAAIIGMVTHIVDSAARVKSLRIIVIIFLTIQCLGSVVLISKFTCKVTQHSLQMKYSNFSIFQQKFSKAIVIRFIAMVAILAMVAKFHILQIC